MLFASRTHTTTSTLRVYARLHVFCNNTWTFSVTLLSFYAGAGRVLLLTGRNAAILLWRQNARSHICVCLRVQNDVTVKMDLLWKFLKPISFALIGKEVDVARLDGTVVAYATVLLIVGSAVSQRRRRRRRRTEAPRTHRSDTATRKGRQRVRTWKKLLRTCAATTSVLQFCYDLIKT